MKVKEKLVVVSGEIEGGHGLPLKFFSVAQKLQNAIKAVKSRCGYYDIKEKSSISYFQELIKRVNKKGDEHENHKKVSFRVSKGIQIEQHMRIT